MSRVTKLLKSLQKEMKSGSQKVSLSPDNLDMSSIEKASFLQGDQYSPHGNPLHSTALEDECSTEPEHPQKHTASEETPKRSTQVEKGQNKARQKGDIQKKNTKSKRKQSGAPLTDHTQKPRGLQVISEGTEDEGSRRKSKGPGNKPSSDDASPESAPAPNQRRPSLSSEALTDEDESFHPSPEKRKEVQKPRASSSWRQRGQKQKRKSSSGSSDHGSPAKKRKPGGERSLIDLDVVLDSFKEFVTEYKESVNSDSVIKAIDSLSRSFEEQLNEKITAAKELNSVKRETIKINGTLNQRKTRLLEVKNELIKSQAEMRKLQKEHSKLEQRVNALTQATTFLTNLRDLKKKYLQYRTAHPNQPETYGVSCLPAVLLQARSIAGPGNQFKTNNDKLQQILEGCGL